MHPGSKRNRTHLHIGRLICHAALPEDTSYAVSFCDSVQKAAGPRWNYSEVPNARVYARGENKLLESDAALGIHFHSFQWNRANSLRTGTFWAQVGRSSAVPNDRFAIALSILCARI
jgi:hypothetical protein